MKKINVVLCITKKVIYKRQIDEISTEYTHKYEYSASVQSIDNGEICTISNIYELEFSGLEDFNSYVERLCAHYYGDKHQYFDVYTNCIFSNWEEETRIINH